MHPLSSNFVQKTNDLFLHNFSDSSISWKNRIVLLFCNLISAKQAVRPDNFLNCLKEQLPHIKRLALHKILRIFHVADRILGKQNEKEKTINLKALDLLSSIEQSLSNKTTLNLSLEDKKTVTHLLNRLSSSQEMSSFETWLMLTHQSKERFKAFKTCKDLIKVLFENEIGFLENKLQDIDQLMQTSDKSVELTKKISPLEYRHLFLAPGKITLLNQFKEQGISSDKMQEMNSRWKRLEMLNAGPVLKKLRELSLKELEKAQLFFGHRFTIRKIRDQYVDLDAVVKSIFIGTLNHVGILTKGKTGVHLSHVGVQEGKHTAKPISDPLFFAFLRTAKLDISPIIPSSVSFEHREVLCATFLEAFERIASFDRPEIAFDENGTLLKTALIGHKNFSSTELSEIQFKPPQAMRCSVYVAMVFLQAIQQVNEKLIELGYSETIPHPFGKHESLYRMDPLRLYYHFMRLNVIKPTDCIDK